MIAQQIGRTPNQAEIADIFNKIPFATRAREIHINNFLAGPIEVAQAFSTDTGPGFSISTLINDAKPRFDAVTSFLNTAQNNGLPISQEQITSIVSASTPERGEVLANQFIRDAREKIAIAEAEKLPARELAELGEEERTAEQAQARFFQEQLQPQILQTLGRRGLLTSGSLAEALGGAAGRLQAQREEAFRPLRVQARIGGLERNYKNFIRQALESGQSTQSAIDFANEMTGLARRQQFAGSEAVLGRAFEDEARRQNIALQLALRPRLREPTGFEQFLQYGVPALASVAGDIIGALSGSGGGGGSRGGGLGGGGSQFGGIRNV